MYSFARSLFAAHFLDPTHVRHGVSCIHNRISEIASYMYLLLEPLNPVNFFADMHSMLPATLLDIESEIYTLLFQKKQYLVQSYQIHSLCLQ